MASTPNRIQPEDGSAPVPNTPLDSQKTADAGPTVARTGKNAIFLAISFLSQIISQVLFLSLVGRFGGAENAGIWTYVIAFTDPFLVIMDFGTTRMLVPEIARRREEADRLLGNALTLGVLAGIPALAALALVANLDLFHHSPTTITALNLTGVSLLLFTLTMSIRSAFRAFNRFDLEAINSVVMAVVLLGGSFGVLFYQAPFIWLFVVNALAALIALLNSLFFYNRRLGHLRWFEFDRDIILRQILGKSWVFMIIVLFFRAYMRIDILILGFFHGPAAVGYYGLVTTLFYRLDVTARLMMTSILPSMSRAYINQRDKIGRYLNTFIKVQILTVLPATVIGFILAPQIISLLYGPNYEASIIFLQLIVLVLPLRFINRTFTVTLTAMDLQGKVLIALVLATIFNIVANLFLIPSLAAMGATINSMASEVVLFIGTYLFLIRVVRWSIPWNTLVRPLTTLLILVPALYGMRNWPLLVSLPLSLVIYGLALFLVRAFSITEIQILTKLMESIKMPVPLRQRLAVLMLSRAHDEN